MRNPVVLIVDDEDEYVYLMISLLKDENYDISIARTGEEAMDIAQKKVPDIILLDVALPGINGFQVCKWIRAHPDLEQIPVLMLTGHDIEESAINGLKYGAEDVIGKPFKITELKLRIRTILRLNRYQILQNERLRFQWVVEKSHEGYVELNHIGNIAFSNSAANKILDIDDEIEDINEINFHERIKKLFSLVTSEAWEQWPNLPSEAYIMKPETKNTPSKWLKVELLELETGKEDCCMLRLRDTSQQIQLKQNIWTFENLVAHKLRTPLNGLRGSLDLLFQSNKDLTSDDAQELIKSTKSSINRLTISVTNILNHLHPPNTEIISQTKIKELILNICNHHQNEIVLNPINYHLDDNINENYLAISQDHFSLVIHEIFQNCKKFHPNDSPQIDLRTSETEDNKLLIEISDDGVNVDPTVLSRLKFPYFQIDQDFTGEIPGMGLGLSRVTSIVYTYGGNILVTNNENAAGLCVSIILPLLKNDITI